MHNTHRKTLHMLAGQQESQRQRDRESSLVWAHKDRGLYCSRCRMAIDAFLLSRTADHLGVSLSRFSMITFKYYDQVCLRISALIGVPSRREGRQYVGQSGATPCRISARILVLGPSLGGSWVSLAGSWDRFACFADREPERVKSRRDTPRCLTLQFHVRVGSSVCQSLRLLGLRTRCSRAWLLRRTHQRLTLALLCPVSIDV